MSRMTHAGVRLPVRTRPAVTARRGATLLFFLLVMIPFAMLSMMLSADLTRLIDAQRQAGYVATNAASAGSLQYLGQSSSLARSQAQQVALQTARANFAAGAMPHARDPQAQVVVGSRQVDVTVSYQLDGLLIAQFFVGNDTDRRSVTRSAEVCLPGQTPTAQGFCSRPRAR